MKLKFEAQRSPFAEALKDFIFPDTCCICGEIIGDFARLGNKKIYFYSKYSKPISSPFCKSCTRRLENNFEMQSKSIGKNFNYKSVFLFDYTDETVKRALMHIKTQECGKCRKFFAEIIKEPLRRLTCDFPRQNCCITHIPRSVKLMKKYGFDQSEQVIRTYVRFTGDICYNAIITRNGKSAIQKKLSIQERFENAKNSLSLIPDLADEHVFGKSTQLTVVFDDIITTGATACATALLLNKNGVSNMRFLFIAGAKKIIERS